VTVLSTARVNNPAAFARADAFAESAIATARSGATPSCSHVIGDHVSYRR
jgi:hypothetical protein